MTRKEVLIVLVTFCLAATLFSIIPVGSQGIREYDVWYDVNDDGKIDLKDYFGVGLKYGTEGTAINKTAIILDLQNRIEVLEERQNSVKTLRFFTSNETINNLQGTYVDGAVFVWTPKNSTDNAILSFTCYFEYRANGNGVSMFRILVDGSELGGQGDLTGIDYKYSPVYTNCRIQNYVYGVWYPNQSNYTIQFQFKGNNPSVPCSVKDVNVILEVMDGLPPN
jgi:hypothetical protein